MALTSACAKTPVTVRSAIDAPANDLSSINATALEGRTSEESSYVGGVWDPRYFDRFLDSRQLKMKGLKQRYTREGIGIPLVGVRLTDTKNEFYYPPEGITRPVTAVVLKDQLGRPYTRFFDPSVHSQVLVDGVVQPLAADFSLPYALLLSRTNFEQLRITATIWHDELDERSGVFLLEPYNPAKIPLLMVHGLLSSPITWRELSNEIVGDELLRTHYQIWHAVYPTGIPYLHAAADFRERLAHLLKHLDPDGSQFASQHIVVVAHSKGGLLCKTLLADSGDKLWNAAFKVPASGLEASPEDIKEMKSFLHFNKNPSVKRAIFIATPHRGSSVADDPIMSFLSSIISLPGRDAGPFERVLKDNRDKVTEAFCDRHDGQLPNGPRALSNADPLIAVLADLPTGETPFHTIVGEETP
ncbi:hypothetical protein BVY02_01355, partial [bacterium J17]